MEPPFVAVFPNWFVSLSFILLSTQCGAADPANKGAIDTKQMRATMEGCLSNRESFPFLDCRFTYTIGQCATLEKALEGQFTEGTTFTAACHWIVDKNAVLYELICDPRIFKDAEDKARKAHTNNFTVPLDSQRKLMDEAWKLSHAPSLKTANVIDSKVPGWKLDTTPFSMNMMGGDEALSPGNLLKGCFAGEYTCDQLTTEKGAGRTTIVLTASHARDKGLRFTYWLDPKGGFLPVRGAIYSGAGKELHRVYWMDVREATGGRWFPWRGVNITDPRSSNGSYLVEEIKVGSLNVNQPPPRSAFHLDLPNGTAIMDPTKPGSSFAIREDLKVRLDDLPKLHQRCQEELARRKARGGSQSGSGWPFGAMTGGTILVLAIGGGAMWYYRRRGRTPNGLQSA